MFNIFRWFRCIIRQADTIAYTDEVTQDGFGGIKD